MSCALLLTLIWGFYHESLAQYCVDQPHGQESFTGESITVPCSFTYQESISSDSMNFLVKASDQPRYCGQNENPIYTFSTHGNRNYTNEHYAGRLSGQYDLGAGTSSFTIKNLTNKDEQMYCCRFIINLPSHKTIEWQHPEGTRITVKGEKDMILKQEHLILALPGDIVTLIARFTFKNRTVSHNITKCDVFWSPSDKGCGNTMHPAACTQRINENIVSVTVNSSDESNGFYCYSINVLVGGANYTGLTNSGTQLLILKPSGALNINQTMEVEVKGSVIINCSFSIQDMISTINVGNRSVLWTQVYWMVGEPREHFVYHPNEDYIHPDYKGKTKLIGRINLLLEDFHGPDNTTLYCRVAVRYCLQNTKSQNPVDTILQEGPGTILRVRETTQSIPEPPTSPVPTIAVASCVGCAFLLFLVLLIICLKFRKDMKRSSAGETITESIDLSVNQNSAYENIERIQRKPTETDVKTLYTVVKPFTTTGATKPPVSEESEDVKTLYTVVKPFTTTGATKPPVSEESEDDKMVYAVVKPSATTTAKKPPASEESEVVYSSVRKR